MSTSNPSKPSRWRILIKIVVGIAVLYAVHAITVRWAEPELEAKKIRIRALRAEVKELGKRVESSSVRQRMAERQVDVLRQANNILRQEESNRQAEMQRLQGEVEFYQRLAGTSGAQEGLAVYQLELQATSSEQVYRFVLTLTQNLRRSAMISGTASIQLEGVRGDKPVTLKWKDITESGTNRPEFRFKYFQQLDGYIAVPEGFVPMQLQVSLNAKGTSNDINREFIWEELVNPGSQSVPLPELPVEPLLEKEAIQPAPKEKQT